MEKKEKEVADEYISSLTDLNLNSKPLINMLTILAEENIEYASVIVKAVEQHISKVNAEVKLPVLYLIDSIVKNVGREYIQLFSHCIVNIFCGVFEKVNEKIREKMYTLRQTWNDVFTPQKLYTLDVKVNCMDPNWPITAKVIPKSPAIHVNPNFLKNKAEPLNDMQAKLRDKQRQLLELQKRKLELELAATKQRLEEQEKQLSMQTESVKPVSIPSAILHTGIRPVFGGFKGVPQRPTNPMNGPPMIMAGPQGIAKTRVAPVNPSMLNTLRYRDPRLARQQQQQQQHHHQQQQQQHQQQQQQQQQQSSQQGRSDEGNSSSVSSVKSDTAEKESKMHEYLGENKRLDGGELDKVKNNSKNHNFNKDKLKISPIQNEKKSNNKNIYEKSTGNGERSVRTSSSNNNRNKSGRIGTKGTIQKPYEKDSRPRDKLSSLERKKQTNKTDSPIKQNALKQQDKSPKRISTETTKSISASGSPNSIARFKDIKQGLKSRNYMRRNREKSKSPTPTKDIDLRSLTMASKRVKLGEKIGGKNEQETSSPGRQSSPLLQTVTLNDSKNPDLEQNLDPVSSMDIDLRKFQTNTAKVENSSGAAGTNKNLIENTQQSPKRSSEDKDVEQPAAKKSKAEKLDTLFGTEDVDLRTLNGLPSVQQNVSSPNMPMTPPPPPIISNESENWAKVKGVKSNKTSPTPKATFEDVRAKLAKATKCHLPKIDKEKESKQQPRFPDLGDESQDGTESNIRTIMTQAQELLDNKNMNADEYNTLLKNVIYINETKKIKEAQRRESLLSISSEKSDTSTQNAKDENNKTNVGGENEKISLPKERVVKPFGKRIPKLIRESGSDSSSEPNATLQRLSPPILTNNNSNNSSNLPDGRVNTNGKPEKRIRQRESKWSSFPWEAPLNQNMNQKPWMTAPNNHRPNFPIRQSPPQSNISGARLPIPSPWQNHPPLIFAAPPMSMPSMQLPPIPAVSNEAAIPANMAPISSSQFGNSVDNPKTDIVRTINIDSVAKEIRIYDQVAVVFMNWDQPREIGFQNGQRRIILNDQEPIVLNFNNDFKTIMIDGKPHKIRFGCPSRELYIDDNWYECCFGGPPLAIKINGKVHVIKIEGPPPQVNIGNLRQDLVAGKINLIVDARIIIPVFLDATLQKFELNGKKHTLQFADFLKTVLINNEPIQIEYGGLPKSYVIGGIKYFVRFSTLPDKIVPGEVYIKNMIKTEKYKSIEKSSTINKKINNNTLPVLGGNKNVPETEITPLVPPVLPLITVPAKEDESIVKPIETTTNAGASGTDALPPPPAAPVGALNIDELFQKLLASGILNQTTKTAKPDTNNKCKSDVITIINLSKPETIKTRQTGIIQKLFCGMQCSSCGVRFPPEQTIKYSQHLDWHFRQNRRERDTSRKAHSRKWYYDVSDWIQYEEIEDLEDREKNWFESQQTELDIDENSNPKGGSPIPSCPAGPDDVERACDMCHDKFDQYYNEELEEWHLRSAVRVDDKIYHPLCHQDYKASLAAAELAMNASNAGEKTEGGADGDDENVVVKEEKAEGADADEIEMVSEGEDDDVIVVPIEESVTEIPDDDEEDVNMLDKDTLQEQTKSLQLEETKKLNDDPSSIDKNESIESDVEIQEPHIPFTDLDTYEEQPPQSVSTLDESSQSSQFNNIKIKEEPKDDDDEDDDFEDVGTFLTADDISQSLDEYVPQPISNSTPCPENLVTSMDGNVENQDAPNSSIGVNKIKINITKNVGTTQKQNVSAIETVSNIPVICNVQEAGSKIESVITDNKNTSPQTEDVSSIDFTYKPELRDIKFRVVPNIESGYDTSGLCSIM